MKVEPRLRLLRQKLMEKEIPALWVSQPDNLFYLSGCPGLEGYLLITENRAIVVTDFRYIEQVQRQSPDFEIFRISGKMADWLPRLISGFNIPSLGFEYTHISFSVYNQIVDILKNVAGSPTLIPAEGLVESLRTFKNPEEISCLQQAVEITDAAYDYVNRIIKPGTTETELAWEIEKFMRDYGSQTVPFELIVAAGPNSALPHARPSDYIIRAGEPIVIDIGSKVNYYGSDLTRTICIGDTDDTFRKIYNTVLKAQQAAIADIKSGMTGTEADAIARNIISQAGYGESFGHSLGHGIGLATHEKPIIGPNSTDILTDGMVFTIEPGIYISGWGGVRIEDDVVMENGKLRVISSAGK